MSQEETHTPAFLRTIENVFSLSGPESQNRLKAKRAGYLANISTTKKQEDTKP